MAATVPEGKTHGRHVRILLDGANISGDVRAIGGVGTRFDQAEATGLGNTLKQFVAGQGEAIVEGLSALFSNVEEATGPTAQGSHTELSAQEVYNASVFMGIRAAPSIGVPTFSAQMQQMSYTVDATNTDAVLVAAELKGTVETSQARDVWGAALAVGTEISATTNHTSVDGGASSAGGLIAYLHLPVTTGAMASNTYAFKLQDSANDSTFADISGATFSIDGSAVASERIEVSGTVRQYVRLVATKTAGTCVPWCTLIRKA